MEIYCKIGTHGSQKVIVLWCKSLTIGKKVWIKRTPNSKRERVIVEKINNSLPPFYFLAVL